MFTDEVKVRRGQCVRVRKRDLPVPLIVEDDNGNYEVQSIEPAGKQKLAARIGAARQECWSFVRRIMSIGRK